VFADYISEYHSFSKIYVNGDLIRYGRNTWTPQQAGSYTFDIEYKFLERDEICVR